MALSATETIYMRPVWTWESRKCQINIGSHYDCLSWKPSQWASSVFTYSQSFGCLQLNLCVCKDIKGKAGVWHVHIYPQPSWPLACLFSRYDYYNCFFGKECKEREWLWGQYLGSFWVKLIIPIHPCNHQRSTEKFKISQPHTQWGNQTTGKRRSMVKVLS